jgi:hypothetical protein
MLMGRKKATDGLSRQAWIDHFYAKTWWPSIDKKTPYMNFEGYNVFYKENTDESWSYCVKREGSPWVVNEDWSRERFDSGEEAKLALLKRFADILGNV